MCEVLRTEAGRHLVLDVKCRLWNMKSVNRSANEMEKELVVEVGFYLQVQEKDTLKTVGDYI